jgi:hypothetical protein
LWLGIITTSTATMTKDGNVPRPQSSFSTSGLTLCTTIVRLAVLFELLPEELSYFLRLPAVESTIARRRETLPFLQVASSFRHFSPTLSQAYLASSSPPPILVWSAYLTLESWWTLLPEYWRRVVWGLGLLLVDYAIARILERIAKSCLEESKENMNEEELQLKMPTVIQPPRAHLFEISSIEKQTDDDMASPLLRTADIPILAANLYYASPITLFASGMYGCFQNVWLGLLLWSIYEMVFVGGRNNSNVTLAAVSLALASYGQPWNSVFVVPICVSQPCKKTAAIFVTMFSLFVLWLQVLEFLLVGSEAYWTWKPLTSLSPNLGPLWYFQMQLFDRFQDYFRIMFIGMPYLVVIPLAIRLYRYPIVLVRIAKHPYLAVWSQSPKTHCLLLYPMLYRLQVFGLSVHSFNTILHCTI